YCGIPEVDREIGGFRTGNTYLVGGIEKSGKSSLLMTYANNMLSDGFKIGFFNTELPDDEFVSRMICNGKNIPYIEVEDNQELQTEWRVQNSDQIYYAGVDDLLDARQMISFENTLIHAKQAIKKGTKVLFFDNLTSYAQNTGGKQGWEVL